MIRTTAVIRGFAAAIVLQCAYAQAANIVVNSTADSGGSCTLRNAIQNAVNNNQTNSGCAAGSGVDTITFDPTVFATPQTIIVGSTLPQLTDSSTTTIDGGNNVTISGQGSVQIFWIGNLSNGAGSVVLRNLVIANGNANGSGGNGYYGGGIQMVGTSLELDHVTFSGNSASFGGGGFFTQSGTTTVNDCIFTGNTLPTAPGGGAYDSGGTLNVSNSTFVGNSADSGAGIFAGSGTVSVTNSTFNGNSSNRGSAIRNFGSAAMTIDYVTISGNSATSFGGGAMSQESSGALTLHNSIVANNSNSDCYSSSFTNAGQNFLGDNSCGTSGSGSPMLAALNYTGGLTPTMVPLPGSPVLGAASCDAVTTDQRGVTRPQNGTCDIGAVEVEAPIFANGFE